VSHYQPLAESQEGRRASAPHVDECPVTTDISARLLRLPLYSGMTLTETDLVIDVLETWPG
jgi:dTDP-4-amino-4,6-dideoxygalactose transaminase